MDLSAASVSVVDRSVGERMSHSKNIVIYMYDECLSRNSIKRKHLIVGSCLRITHDFHRITANNTF